MERNIIKNNIKFSNQKTKEDFILRISGKVDGIEGEGEDQILIETKNRRRRLFDDIPIYEKVQMCIYMKMM